MGPGGSVRALHFTAHCSTATLEAWGCQRWRHDGCVQFEPPWYVLRMPGAWEERRREASPYPD